MTIPPDIIAKAQDAYRDHIDGLKAILGSAKRDRRSSRPSPAGGEIVARRLLELPMALFNMAAKPPYERHFAMTDFGNMLFAALQAAGLNPLFRSAGDQGFKGIEIDALDNNVLSSHISALIPEDDRGCDISRHNVTNRVTGEAV